MKTFESMAEFGAHLAVMALAETLTLHHGLKKCAVAVEKTAKAEIGHYQDAVAHFPAWAPLADSTEAEKSRLGYPLGAPLLRKGDLRDSISHEIDGLEAVIGSDSDIMVYQELGTSRIPPRAVLGPAAIRNEKLILHTLGHAAVQGMLYGAGTSWTALKDEAV
jgi:phage gpG-like protein